MRRILLAFLAALMTNCAVMIAQMERYEYNGIRYNWPSANVAGQLQNDGAGNLTWVDSVPANLIAFTKNGSCPSGWAEYTGARGRSIVGLPLSGTNLASIGSELTNGENRATGQHNHTGSSSGTVSGTHAHGVTDSGHAHTGRIDAGAGGLFSTYQDLYAGTTTTAFATTGISIPSKVTGVTINTQTLTIDNAGSVAGTNAPYLQLMACRKL
jgi:hypothetical protein